MGMYCFSPKDWQQLYPKFNLNSIDYGVQFHATGGITPTGDTDIWMRSKTDQNGKAGDWVCNVNPTSNIVSANASQIKSVLPYAIGGTIIIIIAYFIFRK